MTCAISVAVLVLGCCVPRSAADREPDSTVRGGVVEKHALILRLSPFGEAALRRAIDLALRKLARPECASVYEDFTLQNGVTPRHVLGLGEDPPSSSEITHRVERRCWKAASLVAK